MPKQDDDDIMDIGSGTESDFPTSTETADNSGDIFDTAASDAASEPTQEATGSVEGLPRLRGTGYPADFLALYQDVLQNYSELPVIDYPEIYQMLRELNIQANPVPTPQIISQEIAKVQGYKDRMAEIYVSIQRSYFLKKRLVDVLRDSWFKYSTEKSADKRKADGIVRTSEFESDFAKIETLFKVCTHVIKNLDSVHESLSRRFSIMQFELKLHEAGRMAPDWNFDREVKDNPFDEEKGENQEVNEKESIIPEEEDF